MFNELAPQSEWVGIDIASSPEVAQRPGLDARLVTYDGVHLPLRSASVPFIYSDQVFEHVLHPREVLSEVERILRPGGYLVGSALQLEPFHTLSVWNYTVYGFRLLIEESGLELEEARPGIDGITLIQRTYKGRPPEMSRYFDEESPLNVEIDNASAERKPRPALVNGRKLQFCGHFAFKAIKPR